MSEFDPTKPVQTRNGCEVRIICTDRAHSTYPIIGLVKGDSGEESALYVRKDGRTYNHSCPLDFINIPEEMWTNVLLGQGEKLFAKPEVVVVGYLRVDDAGHVSSFSFHANHANSTFKPHYSVTFTNKGGEITAKIEKL